MKLIALRVDEKVEAEWRDKAKAAGQTLSAWIRSNLEHINVDIRVDDIPSEQRQIYPAPVDMKKLLP